MVLPLAVFLSAVLLSLAAVPALAVADPMATALTGATDVTAQALADKTAAKKRKKRSTAAPDDGLPRFVLSVGDAYTYRARRYVLPRTRVEIKGEVAAALDGQTITVRIKKGGHVVRRETVKLDERGGKSNFSFHFRTGKRGKYVIETRLPAEMATIAHDALDKSVSVVSTNIHRGTKGVAVRLIQNKLAALRYVTPRGGRFDDGTGRALLAFRKNNGMKRIQSAGYKVARKLAEGKGGFKLRRPKAGRHVEVSIKKQVMALADNGKVQRVYHVSTGAAGTPTIRGTFRVYNKTYGTNAKGMVHSSYFIRGYAVHGFNPVPAYPASHGCVRVPVPNAASIFKWMRMGTRVDTYY